MFNQLTYEQFIELSKSHKRIAVYQEVPADRLTPINIYYALEDLMRGATLLESCLTDKDTGRYSFLYFAPHTTISSQGTTVDIHQHGQSKQIKADPLTILREYQQKFSAKTVHPLSRFIGGMVGFISYDAIRVFEDIPDKNENADNIPELLFKFYNDNITFDHKAGKVVISSTAEIEDDPATAYQTAIDRIQSIIHIIFNPVHHSQEAITSNTFSEKEIVNHPIENDLTDQAFMKIVEKGKSYIRQGDVFQVVLSRRFQQKYTAKPFDIYRALRLRSPSPYMFYLDNDDYVITGASPEKLISITDNIVESRPLAGTRPRGIGEKDQEFENDLLQDDKETAEHMMLVDLARNDLGAISTPGSIEIKKLKQVEKFSHVMHLSSIVQGQLQKGKDVFDALKASFPQGTLSGAPKIRAMEIIDELENSRRGIYGGAICAIDSNGNFESCIAIRMAFLKEGLATIRAGAGIVFDSDPQKEADETRHKAKSVLEAIALAEGGSL